MPNRLAGELALLAAAVLLGRGVWEGGSVPATVESALWAGLSGWTLGAVAAAIVARLAEENAQLRLSGGDETNSDADDPAA